MRYDEETIRGNGTIAEEDGRQIRKGGGSGREVKERESGQRLGNNRPRRKIHENLFLISWPIAVYIYAQYGRVRVILLTIWGDRGDSSAFLVHPAKNCADVSAIRFRFEYDKLPEKNWQIENRISFVNEYCTRKMKLVNAYLTCLVFEFDKC